MDVNIQGKRSLVYIVIGVLVCGSIWGFFEATLGGFLHMIIFPNKGAIMGGLGVAIMAAALAYYKKPAMIPAVGIIAASFKLLDVWIFALPITSVHIINPAMAIIFESFAFTLVAVILMRRMPRNVFTGIGAGALVGLMTATAYVYFAIYITNSPLFERMGVNSAVEFIAGQGVVQAAFSAILLPIGYLVGEKLKMKITSVRTRRYSYYSVSMIVICLCWGISAIATLAGL